jgi:hypothetical protein
MLRPGSRRGGRRSAAATARHLLPLGWNGSPAPRSTGAIRRWSGIDNGALLVVALDIAHRVIFAPLQLDRTTPPARSGPTPPIAPRPTRSISPTVLLRSQIHRKKPKGKPMPRRTARANNRKSKVRAAVEHVFARQKGPMGLFIRTIGIARATTKIGLANILLQHEASALAHHADRASLTKEPDGAPASGRAPASAPPPSHSSPKIRSVPAQETQFLEVSNWLLPIVLAMQGNGNLPSGTIGTQSLPSRAILRSGCSWGTFCKKPARLPKQKSSIRDRANWYQFLNRKRCAPSPPPLRHVPVRDYPRSSPH